MTMLPLMRCQFLIPFADICDEIGASTEALLTRFRLPASLEEKAEHYIPILLAIRFTEAAQRSQGITDIGFQAARRLQFCHLSEKMRAIIRFSPTLFIALQQLCKWASLEDTNLSVWLERDDNHVRICSKLAGTAGVPHLEHSQWLQNVFAMHIVRQFTGPHWFPATMAFEACYEPSLETRSFWENTRFMSDQNSSWIDIPVSFLDLPNLASETPAPSHDDGVGPSGHEIVSAVKLMLPSYLDDEFQLSQKSQRWLASASEAFSANFQARALHIPTCLTGSALKKPPNFCATRMPRLSMSHFPRAIPTLRISLAPSGDFPELHHESFVANESRNRRRSRDMIVERNSRLSLGA